MTTCFYLLPGARLPEAAARETAAVLAKSDPASLEAWTALGTGREPPGLQRLAEPLHDRSPHQAWLWKVLTRSRARPGILEAHALAAKFDGTARSRRAS